MTLKYFGKIDCAGCVRMKPIVEALVAGTDHTFEYLDCAEPTNVQVASDYGFHMVPAVVLLDDAGALVYRAAGGLISVPMLTERLNP
jgi:thiol-disulfide isomerase/thioredoxin